MNEQLMIRYLQDACTPVEKSGFEAWLLESEENRNQFYEVKTVWYAARIEYYGSKEQLDKAVSTLNSNMQRKQGKSVYLQWVKYAAIIIGIATIAWLFLGRNRKGATGNEMITAAVANTDSSKLVVLGDGTHVWLNSNSKIIYPREMARGKRTVTLEGEAYFDVTHDAAHPFIIHTAAIDIIVLGTAFNVQAYSPGNGVEAILVRGKIAIGDSLGNELAVMAPGEMARFRQNKLTVEKVNTDWYTSWRYGDVTLNDVDFRTICNKLSDLYQVNINIAASLQDTTKYNFTFKKQKSITGILEMLSFIAPIQYQVQGKNINITPIKNR